MFGVDRRMVKKTQSVELCVRGRVKKAVVVGLANYNAIFRTSCEESLGEKARVDADRGVRGCPGTVVVARRFVVRGRSFVVVVVGSSSAKLVRRRREPGGATGRALLLSLSRLPRRHVPPGYEVPTERKGSPIFFCFFIHLGFCASVSVEGLVCKVE